jgi:hypothetical protein
LNPSFAIVEELAVGERLAADAGRLLKRRDPPACQDGLERLAPEPEAVGRPASVTARSSIVARGAGGMGSPNCWAPGSSGRRIMAT